MEETQKEMSLIKKILLVVLVAIAMQGISFALDNKPTLNKNILKLKITKTAEKTPHDLRMETLTKEYKSVSKDVEIYESMETLKGTVGEYSHKAIMGNNLTSKPIKVEFRNLGEMGQQYTHFDALGWKKGSRLYIYINNKHKDAPYPALGALLAHEALHQDELNSINEETYAWTYEAAVWTQLSEQYKAEARVDHPLVFRENTLKKLFEKGDYTNKYIYKTVANNPGYANLPSRSPGFEDEDL